MGEKMSIKKLAQHTDSANGIVISPRGKYVASFGRSRYLIISDKDGAEVLKLDLRKSPRGVNRNHFCFSFCDKYLYFIRLGFAYRVEIKTGRQFRFNYSTHEIENCNAISVNEMRNIAIGCDDCVIVIWDTSMYVGEMPIVRHKNVNVVKINDFDEVVFGDRKGGVYWFNPNE